MEITMSSAFSLCQNETVTEEENMKKEQRKYIGPPNQKSEIGHEHSDEHVSGIFLMSALVLQIHRADSPVNIRHYQQLAGLLTDFNQAIILIPQAAQSRLAPYAVLFIKAERAGDIAFAFLQMMRAEHIALSSGILKSVIFVAVKSQI